MITEYDINACKEIIKSLDKPSLNSLKSYLNTIVGICEDSDSLSFVLMSINSGRKIEKIDESKYNNLIKKITANIGDFLVSDDHIRNKFSNIYRTKLLIKKDLLKCNVLYSYGLKKQANMLLDQAIKKCKSFEFYNELIEANNLKLTDSNLVNDKAQIRKITSDINHFTYCERALKESKIKLQKLHLDSFVFLPDTKKIRKLKKVLIKTSKAFQKSKSKNLLSIIYVQQVDYLILNGLFKWAIYRLNNLLELLVQNEILYTTKRKKIIEARITRVKLLDLNFAINLTNGVNNLMSFMEPEFDVYVNKYSYFILMSDVAYLKKLQNNFIQNREIENKYISSNYGKYKFTIINFYFAISYLLLGETKFCYSELNNLKDLEKDKEGWNVWIRIYRILAHIEQHKYDLVDSEVESFRKYMERLTKKTSVRSRDQLVCKLLVKLKIEAYRYSHLIDKYPELIQELQSPTGESRWEVESPEKILFHEWIFSRANEKPYQPNFDSYRRQLEKEQKEKEQELRAMPEFEQMGFEL